FDALYAACPICPSYAATDAVKTITPRSPPPLGVLRAIASAASRAMLNDPIRLMLIVRVNEARLCGPSLPRIFSPCTTPAQLTMPCSAPNALCAASTAALPLASSVTSVRTNFADAPSSLASALPSRSLTSASTALPPPATTIRAVAAPRPDAPPLITKTLPRSSIVLLRCSIRSAAAARARANAGAGRRRALLFLRLEYGRRRRHQPGQVGQVRRHDQRVIGLGEIGERGDVLLGDTQVDGVDAAGRDDRLRDLANRLGVRFGDRQDRRRLTLRGVDLGLLDAFRLRDRGGARAGGQVDLLLLRALRGRDHRALFPLGGDLRLHRMQDLLRRRQVLDLVAQHLDAPVAGRLVERGDDQPVDVVALLERAVEL